MNNISREKNNDSSAGRSTSSSTEESTSSTKEIFDIVYEEAEALCADMDMRGIDETRWIKENLVIRLTDRLRDRMRDVFDPYVDRLEEELEDVRTELEQAKSKGYTKLKNELELHKNIIKRQNLVDPQSFDEGRLHDMENYDLLFDRTDDDRIQIIVEEK